VTIVLSLYLCRKGTAVYTSLESLHFSTLLFRKIKIKVAQKTLTKSVGLV
jgi:hypothetical protein